MTAVQVIPWIYPHHPGGHSCHMKVFSARSHPGGESTCILGPGGVDPIHTKILRMVYTQLPHLQFLRRWWFQNKRQRYTTPYSQSTPPSPHKNYALSCFFAAVSKALARNHRFPSCPEALPHSPARNNSPSWKQPLRTFFCKMGTYMIYMVYTPPRHPFTPAEKVLCAYIKHIYIYIYWKYNIRIVSFLVSFIFTFEMQSHLFLWQIWHLHRLLQTNS